MKNTSSETCPHCGNNPCTRTSCCGMRCTTSKGLCWFWAMVRIFVVLLIVAGAYLLGLRHGDGYGEHSRMERGWQDREQMMDHRMDDVGPRTNTPSSENPMNMSMQDMGLMLQGKTGDALDRAFLEGMIPHHQGAVDMARYLSGAKHPELQKLGQDIIRAQTAEIEQMQKWMVEWGYTQSGVTQTGANMPM